MMMQAIMSLRPGAEWALNGEDYTQLNWLDTIQTKPTLQEVQTEIARLQAQLQATTYQRDREPEYPSIKEFADAYYWAQKGDNTLMDVYVAKCDTVKAKYPKPE
jgi:hypothetical protein